MKLPRRFIPFVVFGSSFACGSIAIEGGDEALNSARDASAGSTHDSGAEADVQPASTDGGSTPDGGATPADPLALPSRGMQTVTDWTLVNPQPFVTDLVSVGGVSDQDYWMTAKSNTVAHVVNGAYQGRTGLPVSTGVVHVIDRDNVWLGRALRFRSGRLFVEPNAIPEAHAYFASATQGWAAGNQIWRWDGVNWTSIGNLGVPILFTAIAGNAANNVYALAGPILKRWDGTTWSDVTPSLPGGFVPQALAVGADTLYAYNDRAVYRSTNGGNWVSTGANREGNITGLFPGAAGTEAILMTDLMLAPENSISAVASERRRYRVPCSVTYPVSHARCEAGARFANAANGDPTLVVGGKAYFQNPDQVFLSAQVHRVEVRSGFNASNARVNAPVPEPSPGKSGESMAGSLRIRLEQGVVATSRAGGPFTPLELSLAVGPNVLALTPTKLYVAAPDRAWIFANYQGTSHFVIRFDGTVTKVFPLAERPEVLSDVAANDVSILTATQRLHFDGAAWTSAEVLPTPFSGSMMIAGSRVFRSDTFLFELVGGRWQQVPSLPAGTFVQDEGGSPEIGYYTGSAFYRLRAGAWQSVTLPIRLDSPVMFLSKRTGRLWISSRTPQNTPDERASAFVLEHSFATGTKSHWFPGPRGLPRFERDGELLYLRLEGLLGLRERDIAWVHPI